MIKKYNGHLIRLCVAVFLVALTLILAPICDKNRALCDNFFVPAARVISAPIKFISGLFPFSIFEFAIISVLPVLTVILTFYIKKCRKNGIKMREAIAKFVLTLCFIAGVCFFLYYLLFSLPGRRTRMLDSVYGGKADSDAQDLYELAVYMVENANEAYVDVEDVDYNELNAKLKEGYRALHKKISYVGTYPAAAKRLVTSPLVSYTNTSGIFFALTQEANVNTDSMPFTVPFTVAHEMAHSLLIVSEAEANFSAFLVALECDDAEITYSAYFMASIYCLNALARVDSDLHREAYKHVSAELYADFAAQSAHVKKYEGPVADTSEKLNDWSIKTSGQPSGTASYGEVVDLFMAWYKQK